jgi:hypothetical protein
MDFHKLLDPLVTGGLEAVAGERNLLTELDENLDKSVQLISALPQAATKTDTLDQLEALLDDVKWEVAREFHTDIAAKYQHQVKLLQDVEIDVRDWETKLTQFDTELLAARLGGAPFSALEGELRAARSALNSIRSALSDHLYTGLSDLRKSTYAKIQQLESIMAQTRPQVARVREIVKQADLLIMQVAAGRGTYEYRVLLRSADRQTRGINIIQDLRRVSRKDRDWMVGRLEELTKGVNVTLRTAHLAAHPGAARTVVPAEETPTGTPVDSTAALRALGDFMFRMIIPAEVQAYLRREKWSFSITTNDLELPWELICYDGPDQADSPNEGRFLCLERSVSRMPLGQIFPTTSYRRTAGSGRKRRMLLIHSDPKGTLPAATTEIDTIAKDLANELEFERVNPEQATNDYLNNILTSSTAFDFIHYAGHALFDKVHTEESGLQLKDSILPARKIRLLNKGSSLVFLNACESGTVASENQPQKACYLLRDPEPVVGLASAFVYSGAVGCVGSLWPVYDEPAARLAVSFYRHVLAGEPTGEALRLARNETRGAFPRQITWAAYVLYGDPTFRLTET